MAVNVRRTHSDTVWLLALAEVSIRFTSSSRNRTSTVRAFASPFGSFGRPGFLGFGFWFGIGFELLNDKRLHSSDLLIHIEYVRHKASLE
jgi:hypothetical protein